jgi:hypothetical protein
MASEACVGVAQRGGVAVARAMPLAAFNPPYEGFPLPFSRNTLQDDRLS